MEVVTKELIEVSIDEQNATVPEVQIEEVTALQEALSQIDIHDRKSIISFGCLSYRH